MKTKLWTSNSLLGEIDEWIKEVTNGIGIMSHCDRVDIHKKDLILYAHYSRGGLPKKGVTHFVMRGVVLEVTAILPGENKRKSLHDNGQENAS